jgi:hypothetical protein
LNNKLLHRLKSSIQDLELSKQALDARNQDLESSSAEKRKLAARCEDLVPLSVVTKVPEMA